MHIMYIPVRISERVDGCNCIERKEGHIVEAWPFPDKSFIMLNLNLNTRLLTSNLNLCKSIHMKSTRNNCETVKL